MGYIQPECQEFPLPICWLFTKIYTTISDRKLETGFLELTRIWVIIILAYIPPHSHHYLDLKIFREFDFWAIYFRADPLNLKFSNGSVFVFLQCNVCTRICVRTIKVTMK